MQIDDCAFCRIAAGQADSHVVYRNSDAIAFLPLNPASLGHTLVAPIEHVPDFFDLNPRLAASLSSAVLHIAKAVRVAFSPEGMNLITSAGEAASQSVFHLHVHVVARWTTDRIGEIWPPKTSTADAAQDDVARQIRDAITRLR